MVTKFNYLGNTLNIDCRDNEDVVFRIKKAGNAFGGLKNVCFQTRTYLLMQIDHVAYFSQSLCKIYM